jgi:p-hydroxybenzoate 3-monooxygenase
MTAYSFDHGFSWLTILANAPPPRHPLFAVGQHGYAAHFFRGPRQSRFYLDCGRDDQAADWPEARIWQQLKARLGRDDLPTGEITDIDMFPLRSLVHEPMTYGRLFLLGDAAHIISPMGAKGMNLALYDAEVFARAVSDYAQGDETGLRSYSDTCLARTWNYQEYSRWMTEMLHGACDGAEPDPFLARLAKARLNRLFTSQAAELAYTELALGLA